MSGETPARKRGQAAQFALAVVEAGHEQRDDLHPHAGIVQPLDRVEDRLQPSAELAVVPVVEALEIDLVEIDVRPQVLEHARRAVAVRDEAGDEAVRARFLEDLDRPLGGDERLVVGRDDDPRALTQRVLRRARPASRRAAARSRPDRAAPATSPSSGSSCSADRSRACRSCRRARRDRRGRTASSRPGRTARRRRSPTARAAGRRRLNRTLHTPIAPSGIGQWCPQAWHRRRARRSAAIDRSRPAPAPPRAVALPTSSSCSSALRPITREVHPGSRRDLLDARRLSVGAGVFGVVDRASSPCARRRGHARRRVRPGQLARQLGRSIADPPLRLRS